MKKILIISYFSPPCNLTASNRIESWKDHLPKSDIYPIIVTRNWTGDELTEFQRLEHSEATKIIKDEKSEAHYLEYKSNLRDRLFIKSEKKRFYKILSRILTVINLILQNFSIKFIPYNNFYFKAVEILENDETIETVIISGNPFEQFHFGYLLKKKFPRINWIADYRDDWTTTELVKNRNFLSRMIYRLEKKSEIKWLSNVRMFTTVSPYYVEKISSYIKKKGSVIYNGYNDKLLKLNHKNDSNTFFITYNGSLYPSQNIGIFLEAYKLLVNKHASDLIIKIYFPGLEYDKIQSQRVKTILMGYEDYYYISDRIPKEEVIKIQLESDLLLMVAHDNIKGIPSSKIFEYIGLRKPILLCPSDHDILHEIVSDVDQGYIAEDIDNCFNYLCVCLKERNSNKISIAKVKQYSAERQSKELASIINNL